MALNATQVMCIVTDPISDDPHAPRRIRRCVLQVVDFVLENVEVIHDGIPEEIAVECANIAATGLPPAVIHFRRSADACQK